MYFFNTEEDNETKKILKRKQKKRMKILNKENSESTGVDASTQTEQEDGKLMYFNGHHTIIIRFVKTV